MKRLKLLSIIVLSLAFILNIGTVKATDLLEDDAAIVTSIELKQLIRNKLPKLFFESKLGS